MQLFSTAVAALMSLLSLFTAAWGLHLRLAKAQKQWKEEAVMVRRRSMAMSAAGMMMSGDCGDGRPESRLGLGVDGQNGLSKRWSDAPEYQSQAGVGPRGSIVKVTLPDEEETLDATLAQARRNSRDQQMMIKRAS